MDLIQPVCIVGLAICLIMLGSVTRSLQKRILSAQAEIDKIRADLNI